MARKKLNDKKDRMGISFTPDDEHIYDYLKSTRASALVRALVEAYMDGEIELPEKYFYRRVVKPINKEEVVEQPVSTTPQDILSSLDGDTLKTLLISALGGQSINNTPIPKPDAISTEKELSVSNMTIEQANALYSEEDEEDEEDEEVVEEVVVVKKPKAKKSTNNKKSTTNKKSKTNIVEENKENLKKLAAIDL